MSDDSHQILVEAGQRKVFAIALRWPGWCRFGKDEPSALQNLVDAAPRYAKMVASAGLAFAVPQTPAQLLTVARLEGNATTDFGAPAIEAPDDWNPLAADELERYERLLRACWLAFDQAVENAQGQELRKGPRGGGRDLARIVNHVLEAEEVYLRSLGWKPRSPHSQAMEERRDLARAAVIEGLQLAAAGQIPREGPRGGRRWSPRFFVRRLVWHAVDHAWEIEDRVL